MEYLFTLNYLLPAHDCDPDVLVERLGAGAAPTRWSVPGWRDAWHWSSAARPKAVRRRCSVPWAISSGSFRMRVW